MTAAFLRRPLGVAALVFLVLVVTAAVLAPVIAPFDPVATDLNHPLSGPSAVHWLGTDALGRDLLSRLEWGARVTLSNVAVAVLTVLVLGASVGLAAGFLGGRFDRIVMRVADVMLAVPAIVALLVILAVVGSNQIAVMAALGVLGAPGKIRVVRSATLAVRHELYISAARVSGLPSWYILVRHVLPRVTGTIVVQTALFAGAAVLTETGLGYLGLGIQPPTPSWGNIVADASTVIDQHPWMLVPSGLTIGLIILVFGLLGDAVRDASALRSEPGATPRRTPRPVACAAPMADPLRPRPNVAGAALAVTGLTVTLPTERGEATVVEDLDLHIRPGETVGLVGESGCGKSMTGRAILGLLPPGGAVIRGTIQLDNVELTNLDGRTLRKLRGTRLALISQNPQSSLDPLFPVGHQIGELFRRHHGGTTAAARARAVELLRSVNLPESETIARRYPHQLSGGMAQRVAIALALAGDPEVLIADEPTTALDVTVQAEILVLLRRLQEQNGMAILLISHDWSVVAHMCRRAYVMYAGHAMESGPVDEMVDHPRHPYTSGLLGSLPGHAVPLSQLPTIGGRVPDAGDWPVGCRFRTRCPLATDACAGGVVPVAEPVPGHLTRCLHHWTVGARGGGHGGLTAASRP